VTELVAERDLSATLVALMVTEFGLGRVNGALYFPVASMVPTVEFPVITPLTDQLTVWSIFPVTVAENWVLSPARSVAVGGVTVTPFELELGLELEPPALNPPPQPDHTRMARERTIALANLAPEDFDFPIISDPLS
jgi:hypothetical protein